MITYLYKLNNKHVRAAKQPVTKAKIIFKAQLFCRCNRNTMGEPNGSAAPPVVAAPATDNEDYAIFHCNLCTVDVAPLTAKPIKRL